MTCRVGHSCGLDPVQLWCKPAAAALILPPAWEFHMPQENPNLAISFLCILHCEKKKFLLLFSFFFFFFFCLFRATLAAYGGSQARGLIGGAGLHHSHSNADTATPDPSCICDLHCSSWQQWILNPLNEARDWTRILMDTRWVLIPLCCVCHWIQSFCTFLS